RFPRRDRTSRAQAASRLSPVIATRPSAASSPRPRRAASEARLKRCQPKRAPSLASRQSRFAASRLAATITTSASRGCARSQARARSTRSEAADDTTITRHHTARRRAHGLPVPLPRLAGGLALVLLGLALVPLGLGNLRRRGLDADLAREE